MVIPLCTLCGGAANDFYLHKQREFLQCCVCSSVFLHPENYLSQQQEQLHYETHNNNPEDRGYQQFVSPITKAVLKDFTKDAKGLDFGSGTGSPIVKVLSDNKYNISQYDLFFHNNEKMLQKQYDYISCSEVAEHFKEPYKEFKLLRNLLFPQGRLYLMTELFDENTDFGSWYYKNDPTHVFLYHPKAFEWIKNEFGYKKLTINKRLVILEL